MMYINAFQWLQLSQINWRVQKKVYSKCHIQDIGQEAGWLTCSHVTKKHGRRATWVFVLVASADVDVACEQHV